MKNLSDLSTTGETSQNGSSANDPQNGGVSTPHAMVNQSMAIVPMSGPGAPVAVPGPTTNLNIGMDYWGASAANIPAMRGKVPSTPVAGGIVAGGSRDSVQSQLWLQVNIVYFHITSIFFIIMIYVLSFCSVVIHLSSLKKFFISMRSVCFQVHKNLMDFNMLGYILFLMNLLKVDICLLDISTFYLISFLINGKSRYFVSNLFHFLISPLSILLLDILLVIYVDQIWFKI